MPSTVAGYLEHWLRLQEAGPKSPNTLCNYRWAIEKWLVPAVGQLELGDLAAEDVDDLLLDMAGAGKSTSTMTRVRAVLSMALDHAHRRGHVERNVATLTVVPRGSRRPGRSLTVEQAHDLLDAACDDRLGALVTVGLLLGLRPGELAGLRWSDVDFEDRTVTINQARLEGPGGISLGAPKTARSRRTLALPDLAVEAFQRQQHMQGAERARAGWRWQERGLVFTTTVGTPIDRWSLRRSFARITRSAGLGHWHPTELRHSAVSLMSASGVALEDVADVTGHAGTRTILNVYRHPVRPSVEAARQAMDRIFPAGPR